MLVYVDDSDTAIQYGGGWTASKSFELVEGYGTPLYGTLHGSNRLATFSFSFVGTYVAVFLLSEAGIPSYNCTVDGIASISAKDFPTLPPLQLADPSSGMAACHGTVSDDGKSHELQVTISGSQSNPIFFDYLQYIPTDTITSGDRAFSRGDPSVVLGATDPDTLALLPGSTLDFTFIGSSATIRGSFNFETFSHIPSPVSYAVDGGNLTQFTMSSMATNTTPLVNNQVLIQTPLFPFGKHVLHVQFLGTNDTVPFIPTDFIVQNQVSHVDLAAISSATTPSTSWSRPSWPSHSSPASSNPTPSRSGNHLAILGTALGIVILIVVLLSAIVLVRRKTREPETYIPHHLLQDTNVHPSNQNAPPHRRTSRKSTSRPTSRCNPTERTRTASPVGETDIHLDGGHQTPQRPPEDDTRSEVIEVLPRYEIINDGIT